MIRYLIKNNLKLMFRSKLILVVMIISPILVIALLSSAFEDLMKSYEKAERFSVGYRIDEESDFKKSEDTIKEAGEEAGIVFEEYPEGDPKRTMQKNDLAGFVEFSGDEYTIYESTDYDLEGVTLEYFISQIISQTTKQLVGQDESVSTLPVKKLSFMPAINATDYYGIVYIVYFIWCGIVCIAGVLSSEKKNGITKKYRVAPLSGLKLFLAKWIPCTVAVISEMTITIILCIWLFGITWGNIGGSILILILAAFAAIAFELFIYYVFDNLAVTIVTAFTGVWAMGFLGGSFETYMFSSFSEGVKQLSPIYHINRTLVEYSCMGTSSYTTSCILYMVGIIVFSIIGALLVEQMRRRKKA